MTSGFLDPSALNVHISHTVYIDDATGKLLHLRFCEAETTFDYMLSTRAYIEQYGKHLAFYSDKH